MMLKRHVDSALKDPAGFHGEVELSRKRLCYGIGSSNLRFPPCWGPHFFLHPKIHRVPLMDKPETTENNYFEHLAFAVQCF